ncbi:glycosyltransferase family A protein [Pseudomonas cichorii]|uniref:glycosyltransferase family A protein n=1 Tax=Pseudomonas cichorii TaxID=36746 RepID=UPI001C89BB5C|nr:glycosyltransferase family 2 protein [Pseudomonas cichorii]MBX8483644.1 glycosyltransferase family 2 protein [Pseudomonas cichorii]MBX8521057.1 glycosyltransferase family 2 protein [Pseudomonas cichorii]MBX8570923.1 glycosyltransferase family 2 protein [Pseudomonas cichorii]
MVKKKFTFAVLTFNHESYIVEHLESIRFLIETYGAEYDFGLIIADDGSRDQTIDIINRWLVVYGNLFGYVKILEHETNNGTCFNYTRIWPHVEGELFKITAGDDVYSCVNIFEEAEQLAASDFFAGLPLLLIDGEVLKSKSTIFHILASKIIYQGKPFVERLKNISSVNTPSLFCNKKLLLNDELANFIRSYKVTEDFPMWVKSAEIYPDISFHQSSKVYVYYRRTSGSIYLVRRTDYDNDKLNIFKYMHSLEKSRLGRFLLRNRQYCYKRDNRFFRLVLNVNYYVYFIRLLARIVPISKLYSESVPDISQYKSHYELICKRAYDFHAGQGVS